MKTKIENEVKSSVAGNQKRSQEVHHGLDKLSLHDRRPAEFCICPVCRNRVKCPRRTLCSIMRCPDCGAHMIRDWP